jgi:hypothetical protein
VVGTWQVTQSCFSIRQDLSGACGGGNAWATETVTFTGTLTYNADLTYNSSLGGTDVVHYHYPSSCLAPSTCDQFGQTLTKGGVTNLTCTADAAAATCDCDGLAPVVSEGPTGTYSISGTTLTTVTNGSTSTSSFCVQGNVLHERAVLGDAGTTYPVDILLARQ